MKSVALSYRPATAADFALLRRLHRAGMKAHVAELWGWDEDVQETLLQDRFDPGRIVVLRLDGKDIGILQVTRSPDAIRLDNLLIDPDHQRRGIGRSILDALAAEATRTGATLSLSVLRPNPAKALYERAGFVVTAEDAFRYEMVYRSIGRSAEN